MSTHASSGGSGDGPGDGPQADAPDSDAELVVTRRGSVATLWLNRPAKRNAVTYTMWNGIAQICDELATDAEVRLLVVRGAGEHFCAGADIAGLGDVDPATYQAANEAADAALAAFPKPTLAHITGACIGGGCELAVACDLRIADTTARFGVTPARLGIVYPAAPLQRLVALIGGAATKHLLYSAELIDADHALRIGLVHEVHDTPRTAERVGSLSGLLAGERSLLTQMATKAMLADIADHGQVRHATARAWADEVAASAEPVEGVVAFLEKRPPRFTWSPPD